MKLDRGLKRKVILVAFTKRDLEMIGFTAFFILMDVFLYYGKGTNFFSFSVICILPCHRNSYFYKYRL